MIAADQAIAKSDPRPRVRAPSTIAPAALVGAIGLALALALLVVVGLGGRSNRPRVPPSNETRSAFSEPPVLAVPPDPEPVVERPIAAQVPPPAPPPPAQPPPRIVERIIERPAPPAFPPASLEPAPPRVALPVVRADTPALVIDTGGPEGGAAAAASTTPAPSTGSGTAGNANRAAAETDDRPVRSSVLSGRTNLVPSGTLIPAVLETPVDTARPGLLRAMVVRDVRGFDGQAVLIPRGTRLIGEYDADVRSGQNRVLATWTRLVRPDGTTSRIASPAADALGGGGIPGKLHTFFWQRFASAVLQSALAAGVNYAGAQSNGAVVVALPATQAATSVGQTLAPANDLRPKITVRPGASINVFVARDLELPPVVAPR